jgi:hypothetical protein
MVGGLIARGVPVQVWLVRPEGGGEAPDPGPLAATPRRFRVVTPSTAAAELAKP